MSLEPYGLSESLALIIDSMRPLLASNVQSDAIFRTLSRFGINPRITSSAVLNKRINAIGLDKLMELMEALSVVVGMRESRGSTPFTFLGTQQFAGYPSPCSSFMCRTRPADDLGKFAALYADHVFLPDPVSYILVGNITADDEGFFRLSVQTCVAIFLKLRPLIQAGIVSFVPADRPAFCSDCLSRMWTGAREFKNKEDRIFEYLIERVSDEVSYYLERRGKSGEIVMRIEAPEDFIACGTIIRHFGPDSDFINRIGKKRMPRKLTKKQILDNKFGWQLISDIVGDIRTQAMLSRNVCASYLTTRKIDYDVLNKFGGKAAAGRAGTDPSFFSHFLPVVDQATLASIVRLRSEESDAFQTYREAVSSALKSGDSGDSVVGSELFDDVIRPEIVRLEESIRRSRKLLVRSAKKDFYMAMGGLALGAISARMVGILPPSIVGSLAAVGGTVHYSTRLLNAIAELKQEPKEAIESQFYFLWRLKRDKVFMKPI